MKKVLYLFLMGFICFSTHDVFSQLSQSYVPMAVGNTYCFRTDYYGPGGIQSPSYESFSITKDTLINNVKYFRHPLFSENYVRYDSIRDNFLIYSPTQNCDGYIGQRKIDSFNVHLNDTIITCYSGVRKVCGLYQTQNVLGINTNSIGFYNVPFAGSGAGITYAKGIGIISTSSYGGHQGSVQTLIGCKIYDRMYGVPGPLPPDTVNAPYFPIYTYGKSVYYSLSDFSKILIYGWGNDTIANGRRFINYRVEGGYVSFDTLNGNIIKLSSGSCGGYTNLVKTDSIRASVNDTVRFCNGAPEKILIAEKDTTIFNRYSRIKTFKYMVNGKTLYKTYAKRWGVVWYDVLNPDNTVETFGLKGVHNGSVVSGDTSSLNFNLPMVSNLMCSFENSNLNLSWTTNYEYNLSAMYLEKKDTVDNFYRSEQLIPGKGRFYNQPLDYSISIPVNNTFGKYYYRLRLTDQNGTKYFYFDDVTFLPPVSIELFQNYPNPFNGITKIKFNLHNTSFVNLSIFDISGRKVLEVLNQTLTLGYYSRRISTNELPSGIYFYTLNAGEFKETKKMVLVK